MRKLISIIEDHREVKFPLAHYGLGKAYFKQNRYSVAGLRTEFMDQGSKLAGAGSPGLRLNFPRALSNFCRELNDVIVSIHNTFE